MPEGIELAVYQEILACEGIGAIVWNLETDEIIQDTTLEKILATPLQTEHFSQVLLNRARVHPNDYKLLVDLVAFLSRRHKEYHDNQCTMAFEYRIMGEDGQYQWYHLRRSFILKGIVLIGRWGHCAIRMKNDVGRRNCRLRRNVIR